MKLLMEKYIFMMLMGLTALMQQLLVQGQGIDKCVYDTTTCSCNTNKGTIYLNSATKDTPYTFANIGTNIIFRWMPCKDFTFGGITAGMIQTVTGDKSYDLGRHSLAGAIVTDGFATFSMITTTSLRVTYIKCVCGTGDLFIFSQEYPKLTYMEMVASVYAEGCVNDAQATIWWTVFFIRAMYSHFENFIFTSAACCPSTGPPPTLTVSISLSAGSLLVIVFFSLLVVYFILGTIIQVAARKAQGRERVPNLALWSALPGLIRDGFIFTFTLGRRSGYSNV